MARWARLPALLRAAGSLLRDFLTSASVGRTMAEGGFGADSMGRGGEKASVTRGGRWDLGSSDDESSTSTTSTDMDDLPEERKPLTGKSVKTSYIYDVPTVPTSKPWHLMHDNSLYATPRFPPRPLIRHPSEKGSIFASRLSATDDDSGDYAPMDRFAFQSPRVCGRPPLPPPNHPPPATRPADASMGDVGWADLQGLKRTPKGFLKTSTKGGSLKARGRDVGDRLRDGGFAFSPRGVKSAIGQNIKSWLGIGESSATAVPVTTQLMVPVHLIRTPVTVDYRNVYLLYLEGVMGVGKSTLVNAVCGILPQERVTSFPEPMVYWTRAFTDCYKEISHLLKSGKAGDPLTSAKIYSCQNKFSLPFRTNATAILRMMQPWNVGGGSGRGTHWCVFDRHLLSPAVVFPLMHLKHGRLSFDHFFQLLSIFRATEGDVVAILTLSSAESLRRVRARGRKNDGTVEQNYIRELAWAYHAVYCSWIMLQYITVEQMVQLCVQTTNIPEICFRSVRLAHKEETLKNLHEQSMLPMITGVLDPVRHHPVVIELCFCFFTELRKLQFIVADADKFHDDVCGLWTEIYRQILSNPAIKPRAINWPALESQSKAVNHLEETCRV